MSQLYENEDGSLINFPEIEQWDILAATFLGTCFLKIRNFNHELKLTVFVEEIYH